MAIESSEPSHRIEETLCQLLCNAAAEVFLSGDGVEKASLENGGGA